MSRIGKQEIQIPEKTEVTKADDGMLLVKGPLGELSRRFKSDVDIIIEDGIVTFKPKDSSPETTALWGTTASHVKNMIDGVNEKFEKRLSVEGVGYKVEVKDDKIELALGFSHPVVMKIPEGLTVTTEKNTISVSGIDKESVGQFAAQIRAKRKPEPYKGKGVRYEGEQVRMKEGKKSV